MIINPMQIKINKDFTGRTFETDKLLKISSSNESSIIVLYGRRRVGKTELLEQVFRKRNIIKFEGIEGKSPVHQIEYVLWQLSVYLQEPLISKIKLNSWLEVFQLISKYISKGIWTLYLEELQWLASYKDDLITELKYVWDNSLRYNESLVLILCGSSPSFMINNVLHSKALYNRSQHEIHLNEFTFPEIKNFFGKKRSSGEIMDAYLSVGGIPEYLKYLNNDSSVFLGLCSNAFTSGGFFVNEYERIFTSSLSSNKYYKKIIEFLSKKKFATRNDIMKYLKIESGGSLTHLLSHLELCGFIEKYTPFNLNDNSLLARYEISDQYLQFYFKFIKPIRKRIENGDYNNNPSAALNRDAYRKWQGFAFERMCRKKHNLIAKILGFESVEYNYGAFFSRSTQKKDPGFQIDLVFKRKDKVNTICEVKYLQSPVSSKIISEFEAKLDLFPDREKCTIQKVLISAEGAKDEVLRKGYFDRIITLYDLLDPKYD